MYFCPGSSRVSKLWMRLVPRQADPSATEQANADEVRTALLSLLPCDSFIRATLYQRERQDTVVVSATKTLTT